MTGSIVLLLLGLALLAVAAWLLWRERLQKGGSVDPLPTQDTAETPEQPVPSEQPAEPAEPAVPETTPQADVPDEENQSVEQAADTVEPEAEELSVSTFLVSVRRRRKQWATGNDAEYNRVDSELARQWPVTILQTTSADPDAAIARDIVSSFYHGHEFHIADVGDSTLMALRRAGSSPAVVHYSRRHGVPAGLRRSELLDQPPFFAYTTDVRALDRMLDVRVEDGLTALSQVATDVVWGDDWVVVRVGRKLDTSVWEQILPHLTSLADAGMVLPPRDMNVPLEMDKANQSRPLPGRSMAIPMAGETAAEETTRKTEQETTRRPDYLRSVPDKPRAQAQPEQTEQAETGQAEPEQPERPEVTRPAEPVDFPTRSHARSEGEPVDFTDSTLSEESADIPPLGESPDHITGTANRGAQVIRVEVDHEATIFDDELSASAAQRRDRRRGGRHRAPDARHARPTPIEPVETEIETVDAEVVEDLSEDDLY